MTVVPIARGSGHRFQVYGRRDRKPVYLGTFSSLVDAQDQERAHRAEQRDPPGITAGRLSEEFGVRIETVHRWASTGLIPFHLHGKRRRFVVDEVSSALRANGWRTGGRLSDPGSTKGQERIRRRVDQGTGSHACGRCGKTLPDECFPPSSGIRCGWWCKGLPQASEASCRRAPAQSEALNPDRTDRHPCAGHARRLPMRDLREVGQARGLVDGPRRPAVTGRTAHVRERRARPCLVQLEARRRPTPGAGAAVRITLTPGNG